MLLTPLLGGPALKNPWRRRLYRSVLAATAAVTTAWMLAQYAFQVMDLHSPDGALADCTDLVLTHVMRTAT